MEEGDLVYLDMGRGWATKCVLYRKLDDGNFVAYQHDGHKIINGHARHTDRNKVIKPASIRDEQWIKFEK